MGIFFYSMYTSLITISQCKRRGLKRATFSELCSHALCLPHIELEVVKWPLATFAKSHALCTNMFSVFLTAQRSEHTQFAYGLSHKKKTNIRSSAVQI